MGHITIQLGDKHIDVLLDSLRSYIQDIDFIINTDPKNLDKKQLKIQAKIKRKQKRALTIISRVINQTNPK